MPPKNFINLSLTMASTIFLMSSNNWMVMWTMLELNMMFFTPLLSNYTQVSLEASMKYFLIQTTSSSLLLILLISYSMIQHPALTTTPMLMKMGVSPFFNWIIKVNMKINYLISIIFLTWQKLAPLSLLTLWLNKLLTLTVLSLMIIPSLLALNQIKLKAIMAYSSVFQTSWIMMTLYFSKLMMVKYFTAYSLITAATLIFLSFFKLSSANSMTNLSLSESKIFIMNMMSLAGIPPLPGFFMKWIIIMKMIMLSMFTTINLIIMYSVINIYFYLQPTFTKMTNMNMYWGKKKNNTLLMISITLLMLPLTLL